MNKTELIAKVAETAGLSKVDAKKAVEALSFLFLSDLLL